MNDKFNEQKDVLESLMHEIKLLQQQVSFLIRNEREIGLLDLDVMMNRTHTIYDKMCSIDIGGYSTEAFEEEEERHCEEQSDEAIQPEPAMSDQVGLLRSARNDEDEEEPVAVEDEEPLVEENEDAYFEEEVEEEDEERHCEGGTTEAIQPDTSQESENDADDLGFILNFEPTEDHSLAAKLQHESISDLRSAIGINDKFLLVNELFGGSMEKYNKSIDNLNDLKTLNGALVYMNELRIELQWNSNNEAYKKLLDLVHRKFE